MLRLLSSKSLEFELIHQAVMRERLQFQIGFSFLFGLLHPISPTVVDCKRRIFGRELLEFELLNEAVV